MSAVPERAPTREPAHPNARTVRRDKRLTEAKGINTRVRPPPRLVSTQVGAEPGSSVTFPKWSQRPMLLFSVPRRGHPALQPTTVPDRQQSQGPKFLQLHVLQGFGGPAERGRRPQEPRRHWPQHHGSLPARRRGAGGTVTEDLHGPPLPSRSSNQLVPFSTVSSDFFVSVLIAGVLSSFFTQMIES